MVDCEQDGERQMRLFLSAMIVFGMACSCFGAPIQEQGDQDQLTGADLIQALGPMIWRAFAKR